MSPRLAAAVVEEELGAPPERAFARWDPRHLPACSAVLGELSATADWRAISEEIWPFTHGPASTPMGEAEAAWQARRQEAAA